MTVSQVLMVETKVFIHARILISKKTAMVKINRKYFEKNLWMELLLFEFSDKLNVTLNWDWF